MTEIADMADAERAELYEELKQLSDDQWSTMTVCAPWTVRHLVAHLTALGNQTAPNFFKGLIKNGFSFDKFVDRDLQTYLSLPDDELLAAYGRTVENPRTPPGPKYVSLGELMMHGEDIRRALGRTGQHPTERIEALAPLYAKTGKPIDGKRRADGLTLRATDADWSHGDGPEIAGPGVELIRAMTGRGDGLDRCSGDGLETLRSRCR